MDRELQRDPLTGLYTRTYFLEMIENHINKYRDNKKGFSIVILNIEGLSKINDSLGHVAGDELLIQVSKKIDNLTCTGCSLSRVGDNEFGFICKNVSKNNIAPHMKAVLKNLSKPYEIEKTTINMKLNMGISRFPADGDDVENLFRYANIALTEAKNLKKGRLCFYSKDMSDKIEEKFHMENYLSQAIINKELSLNYQPLFDIKDESLIGVEALLRWDNPFLGPISPGKFIPVAEKTGRILSIGCWVIREVCKQINVWKNKGYKIVPVSINVSVKQFEQDNFAQAVINILKENKIHPSNIELEITESLSLGDIDTITSNLKELKKAGFKISIDDFGKGYSSLAQLNLFEIDKIKIDKSFIDDLALDEKSNNIVKTVIRMAKDLNISVAAEGIETIDQLEELKKLECELGQGYLYSKPLKAEKMDELLKNKKESLEKLFMDIN